MIDNDTRDRIIKRMTTNGGFSSVIAALLQDAIGHDGEWQVDKINRYLAGLTEGQILDASTDILDLAAAADNIGDWCHLHMIDATLDSYRQRDISPLLDWLNTYAADLPDR